ncbi:MAG: DUF748 domain-containing protein [Verrucomicrobia bacterium]|nr:DUF748 domain-containing protein [Verrucomicrobiota bacterium]
MSQNRRSASAPSLQELRAARGVRPSFFRRFRRSLIAVGALVLLILFGFFGLPPIAKAQAIKQLSARLGRTVTIDRIELNPLALSATIEGFAIADAAPGTGVFTGWRRLHVNLSASSLYAGELRLEEVSLDGFKAHIDRTKTGGFNFDDILAQLAVSSGPAPAASSNLKTTPKKTFPVFVGKLAVSDASIQFNDAAANRPYALGIGPITFALKDFHTVGEPNAPYQFEAVTSAGAHFVWKGKLSADPVKSSGDLLLQNIDIAHLTPYFDDQLVGDLHSAFVDFSGRYAFELKPDGPALTLADGSVILREVRIGAPGATTDAFVLKRLAVTGIHADAIARRAAIAKIAIEGVDLKAARDANGIDLLRLFEPKPGSARALAAKAPHPAAAPGLVSSPLQPAVTIGEISVSGVRIDAADLTTARHVEQRIDDLTLTVRDLDSTKLDRALPLELGIKLPRDGRIALTGTVIPQPLAADLAITLEHLALANSSPYLEPLVNVRLADGFLRTRGRATLRDGVASFTGDFGLGDVSVVDGKLSEDFLKWTDLAVTGIKLTSAPFSFHADEIRFVEPTASVRIEPDGTLSIASVAQTSTAPASASEATVTVPGSPVAEPLGITIDRFSFEQAAFRFEDRSIRPAARAAITEFSGAITGLSAAALGRAEVSLKGKVDGVAPVTITGKLNPLGRPAFVDVNVDFKGIDLQPGAGPYIGKYAGRTLARGNLNVAVKARLQDRKIDASNVVTLDQFFLGEKTNSPDATKLPVGLALALLRDTQGKIVIDVPVKGSLDDPEFKIGRVVGRVLVNILSKAATSPFSLLGAAFGGGGEELGWQEFAPGSTELDEAAEKKLQTVAKALNSRPALSLDIVGGFSPVPDLVALRRSRLERSIRTALNAESPVTATTTPAADSLEITPEQRAAILTKLYAAAFPALNRDSTPPTSANGDAMKVSVPLITAPKVADASLRPRTIGRITRFRPDFNRGAAKPPDAAPAPGAQALPDPAASPQPAPSAISVAEMETQLLGQIRITDAEVQQLGDARAQAIRSWFLEKGGIASERVFLAPSSDGGLKTRLNLK